MESAQVPVDWRDDPRLETRWTVAELDKPIEYLYTHHSVPPKNVDRQDWIASNVARAHHNDIYTLRDWVVHLKENRPWNPLKSR